MIAYDKDEKIIFISCNRRCGVAFTISKNPHSEYDTEQDYFIYTQIMEFDAQQRSLFHKITNRIKTAWSILLDGIYRFHEIMVNENDIVKLKKSLEKAIENGG